MRPARKRSGAARVLLFAALVAPAIGLGVVRVWSRTQVLGAGYDLARLESERRRLVAERDRLRIEVATLREPGRLERFARERLGMAPPAPGAVVAWVSGGKLLAGGVVGGGAGQRPGPAEPVASGARARDAPAVRLALSSAVRAAGSGAP